MQKLGQLDEIESRSVPGLSQPGSTEALSVRQRQVLTLVAQGLSYKEVGAKLHLAERTVKYHMGEIVQRLQMDNRAQVIEYARRTGLVR